jgi:hypothetical protein
MLAVKAVCCILDGELSQDIGPARDGRQSAVWWRVCAKTVVVFNTGEVFDLLSSMPRAGLMRSPRLRTPTGEDCASRPTHGVINGLRRQTLATKTKCNMNIFPIGLGGFMILWGSIAMVYFNKHKDKLPPDFSFTTFARLCSFIIMCGTVLVLWQFFIPMH